MSKIYKLNVGAKLTVDTVNSVAAATSYYLIIQKPGYTTESRFPAVGNCTRDDDTHLSYTFAAGELNVPGTWKVQPYLVFASSEGRGETASFEISEYMD